MRADPATHRLADQEGGGIGGGAHMVEHGLVAGQQTFEPIRGPPALLAVGIVERGHAEPGGDEPPTNSNHKGMLVPGAGAVSEEHTGSGPGDVDGRRSPVGPGNYHHASSVDAGIDPRPGPTIAPLTIQITDDADALAEAAADAIAHHLSSSGRDIGLAGGGTPQSTYRRLARRLVPWPEVHAWTTDERYVPPDHQDSNAGMARRALFDQVPATLHAVPWRPSPADAAAEYAQELLTVLPSGPGGPTPTTIVLGVGDDGHTASLFPGSPALEAVDRDYVAADVPGHGMRLTATLGMLARARHTLFLVSGAHKAEILAAILGGGSDLPAARVAREAADVLWLVDRDAARLL